jgi:AmmeMemoRadiSam system protein B/AmmeMemoRadiSam system protein A
MQVLRHADQRQVGVIRSRPTCFGDIEMKRLQTIVLSITLILMCVRGHLSAADEDRESVRPAAVAGMFYPHVPDKLRHTVGTFLKDTHGVKASGKIRGLVSPHAGYIYSGIVAAAGYKQIDPSIRTVILLGPSHRVRLTAPSIPEVQAYRTPLGDVRLARLASTLRRLPGFKPVPEAHLEEHALEVQLPFLQVMLKEFEIVPILTNSSDPKALASTLAPYVDKDTLVVASSDLSHYYSYEAAVTLDRFCTSAITGCKFSDMALCEACGKQAVLTLMHIAQIKGWKGTLADYRNSGDTAGNRNRVVGYTSIAFVDGKEMTKTMKETLSTQDRESLLRLARTAIMAKLVEGAKIERPTQGSSILNELRGCFVTLHKRGQLRGCIGTIEPTCPLLECVEKNAKNAAFGDPRFPPLSVNELKEIDLEISVLSVPEALGFDDGEDLKRKLEPNVHGVILSCGMHRSTFLPQVWKQLPDKEKFLEHLCLKGGMSAKAWQDPGTKVEVYRAEVFGEDDLK